MQGPERMKMMLSVIDCRRDRASPIAIAAPRGAEALTPRSNKPRFEASHQVTNVIHCDTFTRSGTSVTCFS